MTAADLAATTGIEVPTGLLIGGEWTKGGAGVIGVTDPATEETIAEVADGTAEDALDAVAAAQAALPGWAATPPRQRAECLRRAWALMTERSEAIARLMVLENGKALPDARAEASYAAEFFRWYAEEAVRLEGSLIPAPAGGYRIMVQHQPVGVSVLITPWNFPAAMATRKIGPALAAGCSVVLKPAKETPLTALAVAGILREAGVPDGVVNVVTTSSASRFSGAVLADPRVRKLSFTGSTEVGRVLLKAAADQVINCSMELGGNAPFLIFEDADIKAALDGAFLAKMRNGGEACTAANRFYVHEAVADEFTAAFAARLGALRVGPGLEPGTELGPLVNEDTRSKVASLVADAASAGGRVLTGGAAPGPARLLLQLRPCWTTSRPGPASSARRSSGRWRRSSGSAPTTRPSPGPTTPSTAWSPTCTPRTCAARCGCRRRWKPAWSVSTAGWCPTQRRRSAGSSSPGSAARGAMTACWSSPSPSTSPSIGNADTAPLLAFTSPRVT